MVEGPGCTLNGEKIRSKVQKGQKLKEIRGSLTKPTVSYVMSRFALVLSGYRASVNLLRFGSLRRKTTLRDMPSTVFMVVSTPV